MTNSIIEYDLNVIEKLHFALEQSYIDAQKHLESFVKDKTNMGRTSAMALSLANAFKMGKKILICGNGGSACDAMHFAEEFTGQYRHARKALPVISLLDPAFVTCVGNDFGFENIFARGVEAYGQPNDWLIVLSTSGNSANIIKAVEKARENHIHTLALLGKDGGKLKGMCDEEYIVPAMTSDRIQEIHMMILHILIEGVERILFPENY